MTHQLDRLYTQSQLVNRAQHLQTVAVEASDQLRDQTIQLMQAQSIRLEDMADTEIEDVPGMDQCMNELMQCILYTELRKDVREVTDKLEEVQRRLFSSKQDLCSDAAADDTTQAFSAGANGDDVHDAEESRHISRQNDSIKGNIRGFGDDALIGKGANGDISNNNGDDGDDDDDRQEEENGGNTTPTQLSTTETFRTARGVPMFSDAESTPLTPNRSSASKPNRRRPKIPSPSAMAATADAGTSTDAASKGSDAKSNGGSTLVADLTRSVEHLEQQLYNACVEIHEWRRSRCVAEFIEAAGAKLSALPASGANNHRSPSIDSSASSRILIERIIGEARERQRMRASSLGHQPMATVHPLSPPADKLASSLHLSASPPLSRLLRAEREAESLRQIGATRPYRSPSLVAAHPVSDTAESSVRPTEASVQTSLPHFSSLRLIDTSLPASSNGQEAERHRTLADDVRIIGWVTRGSGLDVHTEFKVVVHLTRGENLTVMRRYTDFVDLRVVLCERYPTFRKRIPQLPPKKAFGKFEDKFLKKRESGLQFFLAYVMLHPVIGCSSIIKRWL
ncbi:hypothetical protein LPJ75_002042, partial [Coemansia sp. RSA 2598]